MDLEEEVVAAVVRDQVRDQVRGVWDVWTMFADRSVEAVNRSMGLRRYCCTKSMLGRV
jgi:DNA-directed RNA polymerase subunit N (RpoN/RPB10)